MFTLKCFKNTVFYSVLCPGFLKGQQSDLLTPEQVLVDGKGRPPEGYFLGHGCQTPKLFGEIIIT